jgi:predicted Fe-Mo cluster-binding NifX family protein
MSKVAFTTILDREDATLSDHFGAAPWVVIHDEETAETIIQPNPGTDGRAVASLLTISDCTDVVCAEIGPVALKILWMIGVRAWHGPLGVPANELLAAFRRGELQAATPSAPGSVSRADAAESEPLCTGSCGGHPEDTIRVTIKESGQKPN